MKKESTFQSKFQAISRIITHNVSNTGYRTAHIALVGCYSLVTSRLAQAVGRPQPVSSNIHASHAIRMCSGEQVSTFEIKCMPIGEIRAKRNIRPPTV